LLDLFSLLDCIQLAEGLGEDLDDIVGVYFLVSETFSIDAMLGRVTALSRDDRWDALARGALRDDLYAVLGSLTRSVLEVSTPGAAPEERLAEWSRLNIDGLSRARTALGGIERMTHPGIAALSVALRTLRTVMKPPSALQPAEVRGETAGATSTEAGAGRNPGERAPAGSETATVG
jgi:glutamate dehydrogenase